MKFGLPGLPTMATLCLIVVLTCWLGIGGAVISEIKVQGFLQTMEKWQTLIGVGAALAVGYIAVRPVWRQVKIMGAQAALLLGPAIQEDLDAIDRDKGIIARLRLCDAPLRDIGDQIEFAKDRDDIGFVSEINAALIAYRARIEGLPEADWAHFCHRLRLDDRQRHERNEFRDSIAKLKDASERLSMRQQARGEMNAALAKSFIADVREYIVKTRDVLRDAFPRQEIRILLERKRLLQRGKVITDAMDAI
jgi:hypothetical protein